MNDRDLKIQCYQLTKASFNPLKEAKELYDWLSEGMEEPEHNINNIVRFEDLNKGDQFYYLGYHFVKVSNGFTGFNAFNLNEEQTWCISISREVEYAD